MWNVYGITLINHCALSEQVNNGIIISAKSQQNSDIIYSRVKKIIFLCEIAHRK